MSFIIDIPFVIAITAFFREHLQLKGRMILLCAFGTALFFNFAPLIGEFFPAISPWLDALLKTFVLFVAASGAVDAVRYFFARR